MQAVATAAQDFIRAFGDAGLTPMTSEDNEVPNGADERSSLLSRKGSMQARGRASSAFSRANSSQPEFARQKSGSPLRSTRTPSTGLVGDIP